ncbi:MAG: NAD(P)-dependent oxidoreductase [Anaerolineae bacterium]|nr:NAD(P)-dependent oxidoreductase [Anaerolineae bacterium]
MNILVTGSSGQIGHYIVRDLVEAGHEVLGVDLFPPLERLSPFLRVDLRDAGETYQAVAAAKAEAVIHMGAWADAGKVPDIRTYPENVQSTFNVFQACADMGIRRIVSASSGQIYGLHQKPPAYVPLDEAHPLRPINVYALSKMAGEQMADYFVANHGLTILSFRFTGVRSPDILAREVEEVREDAARGISQLWMRTDARDAAAACRQAVEIREVDSGPYNIVGFPVLDETPDALLGRFFGDQIAVQGDLSSSRLISTRKAGAAFGYRPRYLWSVDEQRPKPE